MKKPNSLATNRKSKTEREATQLSQLGWEMHSDNCLKEDTHITMWNNVSVAGKQSRLVPTVYAIKV
jgi:hypothetical protein